MKKFKFSFNGRQAGAIGIFYKITDTYKAKDIHEALSLLYEDYEHISGLECDYGKTEIPKTIDWVKVRSHRERERDANGGSYKYTRSDSPNS